MSTAGTDQTSQANQAEDPSIMSFGEARLSGSLVGQIPAPFKMPEHEDFPKGYTGTFEVYGGCASVLYRIEPGDATSYHVVVTRVGPGQVSGLSSEGGYVISFIQPQFSSLVVPLSGCLSVGYVMEKTGANPRTAESIRDFVCQITGHFVV